MLCWDIDSYYRVPLPRACSLYLLTRYTLRVYRSSFSGVHQLLLNAQGSRFETRLKIQGPLWSATFHAEYASGSPSRVTNFNLNWVVDGLGRPALTRVRRAYAFAPIRKHSNPLCYTDLPRRTAARSTCVWHDANTRRTIGRYILQRDSYPRAE